MRRLPGLDTPPEAGLPAGFRYLRDFLGDTEEARLITTLRALPLAPSQYRTFVAKRRILSFGGRYDFTHRQIHGAPPIPAFLLTLRNRAAEWLAMDPARFVFALVSEYLPGAPIGWHRDAPEFGLTVGVSLLGRCRLRFRPYRLPCRRQRVPRARDEIVALDLEPRSAYVIGDEARWDWQHSIPPVTEPRLSITFRTAREPAAAPPGALPRSGLPRT